VWFAGKSGYYQSGSYVPAEQQMSSCRDGFDQAHTQVQ